MKTLTRTIIILTLAATTSAGLGQVGPSAAAADFSKSVTLGTDAASGPVSSVNVVSVPARKTFVTNWLGERRSVGTVLVIPSTEIQPEQIAAIMQDMTIMARILDARLEQEHLVPTGSAYALRHNADVLTHFLSPDGRGTESIYLQGFGPLFLVNVDFPLSPSAQEKTKEPEQQGTDQLWWDTWVEVYHPEEAAARKKTQPERQYDAAKVEDLQTTLIKTLKHAANIRTLGTDESVTLVVRSSAPAMTFAALTLKRGATDGKLTLPLTIRSTGVPAKTTVAQAGFLTIRAKKSDIDSFARDELNYDQFRQRVQIIKY